MARFRLWEKKRGHRRTGSKLWGGLGEVSFYAALFLAGSILLAVVVTFQVLHSTPDAGYFTDWGFWLRVLILVVILLIGAAGVFSSVLRVSASQERRTAISQKAAENGLLRDGLPSAGEFPNVPLDADITNSPGVALAYRLPVARSPVKGFLLMSLFCAVLAGFGAVLVVLAVESHLEGKPNWTLTVFAALFAVVGAWAALFFLRQLLMHTGIGPTSVEISDHPLRPGRSYRVFVTQAGRLNVESLELWLVCEEEATYQQGTDIRTESREVFRQLVFREEEFRIEPAQPFEYECDARIPDNVMHSFQSTNNSVHWNLAVNGHVNGWPAFRRTFSVVVYPATAVETNA